MNGSASGTAGVRSTLECSNLLELSARALVPAARPRRAYHSFLLPGDAATPDADKSAAESGDESPQSKAAAPLTLGTGPGITAAAFAP